MDSVPASFGVVPQGAEGMVGGRIKQRRKQQARKEKRIIVVDSLATLCSELWRRNLVDYVDFLRNSLLRRGRLSAVRSDVSFRLRFAFTFVNELTPYEIAVQIENVILKPEFYRRH